MTVLATVLVVAFTGCGEELGAARPAPLGPSPAARVSDAEARQRPPPPPVVPPPPSSLPSSDPPAAGATTPSYDLRQVSSLFDFRLEAGPAPTPASDDVTGPPGRLTIFRKGTTEIVQTVPIASLSEHALDPRYEPSLLVEDYDFDGHEDLALHTGDAGPYGAPTYSVFLYAPATRTFTLSRALSELAATSIVPMRADAARKRLMIESKSGCCIHWGEEHELQGGAPRLMKRETEAEEPGGKCVLTVETRRGSGGMKRETRPCQQEAPR
jgi:hypothetical protein